jgi:hypothetical protein
VPGGKRNQVRETLERDAIAVMHGRRDRVGKGEEFSHVGGEAPG